MKIMFVITGLNQGGAEAMLFKLLSRLDKEYFDCVVISMQDMGLYGGKIQNLGFPVICLNMRRGRISLIAFVKFLLIIRQVKPDIIQAWMFHANLLGALAKLFFHRKVLIFNIRNGLQKNKVKILTKCVIKANTFFSFLSNFVINNSHNSIRQYERTWFGRNNSFYIANGFDVDMYSPNEKIYRNFRRKNSLPGNAKIIGNISRFHPVKNHIGMLKVFQRLKSCYPGNLILVLCGDQVDNSNSILREEIVKVNLSNDCLLLGPVESYQILPAFDVYLSASWQEGFPNVIGEAMACGVPCVVTDVGDCKYIVSQYGSVGKPGDYEALSKYCFEELIKESNKEQLRQYVIENYLIQKVVKQYEDLYRSIIF